jgi:hypothetical protein
VARGYAVTQLLTQTREQRERAETLEKPKGEKRLAAIATSERRQLEGIDRRYALESFVSRSVRKRKEIEREAPFLERHAEHEQQREAQRAQHEAVQRALDEMRRAAALEQQEQQKKSRGRSR